MNYWKNMIVNTAAFAIFEMRESSQTDRPQEGERMSSKCYVEKRFFEWYEDEVSVTLRSVGASYGGQRADSG